MNDYCSHAHFKAINWQITGNRKKVLLNPEQGLEFYALARTVHPKHNRRGKTRIRNIQKRKTKTNAILKGEDKNM